MVTFFVYQLRQKQAKRWVTYGGMLKGRFQYKINLCIPMRYKRSFPYKLLENWNAACRHQDAILADFGMVILRRNE